MKQVYASVPSTYNHNPVQIHELLYTDSATAVPCVYDQTYVNQRPFGKACLNRQVYDSLQAMVN
ncbi:hypothetical protein D9M71_415660 [compost metagenome]